MSSNRRAAHRVVQSFSRSGDQTDDAGAVKTCPNVHRDYNDVPIGSFNTITSTFAETSPHVGIYGVAYDIWTNGVPPVALPNS
jgi:hypothetical protein